ncbi:MAG: hypothetical protein HY619_05080 [Thaumarchaeota archaeon]|nr:hypothetical protein [Nitrososphaerota archaeon]
MADGVKIYKPTLMEEKPLPLEPVELSYATKLLEASRDGLIPVQLEQDVVIQRISHDLYAKPESGFRELYNNEARACRIATRQYAAKPRIEITLVPSDRRLTIHGIDSLGMSQEKFLTVYTVLGRSDNWDGKEVGMFGFGRASYTTLSDIMILETFSRETGEKYAVMGKNGVGFNVLPQPELSEPGTRVTLTLRDNVSLRSIIEAIVKVSRFSSIETYLNLEEDLSSESSYYYGEPIHERAGRYRLGPESFKEHLIKRIRRDERDYRKIESVIPIEIEDEDFYLFGAFTMQKTYDGLYVARPGSSTGGVHLVGTPIEAPIELPFSGWILNIKDERKYPPTADRERLSGEAAEAISKRIDGKVREALAFLELHTVDDYLASKYQEIYDAYDELHIERYLSQNTVDICKFIKVRVKADGSRDSKTIGELLERSRNLFYLQSLNMDRVALIKSKVPDAIVIRLLKRDSDIEALQLLRRFGVGFGDEFIRENKLKQRRTFRPLGEIAVHSAGTGRYSWGRFEDVRRHVERAWKDDLDEKTIRIPKGKMRSYLILLSMVQTSYRIVKDDPRIQRGISLRGFVDKIASKSLETSDGKTSYEAIGNSGKAIKLVLYSDIGLSKHLKRESMVTIIGDPDTLFELMAYLQHQGVNFELDGAGSEALKDIGIDLWRGEFINDPSYPKIGDSEITYSIIHSVKKVKDERLLNLFLSAARHSRDAEEIRKMRSFVFELNRMLGGKES